MTQLTTTEQAELLVIVRELRAAEYCDGEGELISFDEYDPGNAKRIDVLLKEIAKREQAPELVVGEHAPREELHHTKLIVVKRLENGTTLARRESDGELTAHDGKFYLGNVTRWPSERHPDGHRVYWNASYSYRTYPNRLAAERAFARQLAKLQLPAR